MSDIEPTDESGLSGEAGASKLLAALRSDRRSRYSRFVLAALGSIPWVGGFLAASAALDAEKEQQQVNDMHRLWIDEHKGKVEELGAALGQIIEAIENVGEEIEERLKSPSYLSLIRQGFRQWDQSETQEKKDYVRKLLSNAGSSKLVPDDLLRLFLDWVDMYHEAHFFVIKEIYRKPGITRYEIWANINGEFPREDSAEADLFKLLIRDLSTGSVIRQHREKDYAGNFIPKPKRKPTKGGAGFKSAFDREEPYELTELGTQFVHYTMEEVSRRIGDETGT